MVAREVSGQSATVAGILRGVRVVIADTAAALEVAELTGEVPGLHVVATRGEAGPAGLQLDGQLFELILEVALVHLFAAVSYHFRVCCLAG